MKNSLSSYSLSEFPIGELYYNTPSNFTFNGQETDGELGEGVTTAEFWEYDGKLGRRWNIDPVVKPWRSSYDVFSNSPTSRIDINGDDDYFNSKGKYLGSDGSNTNNIRVLQCDEVPSNLYVDVDGKKMIDQNVGQLNSTTLSSFNYSAGQTKNRGMLGRVANYYSSQTPYNGKTQSRRGTNRVVVNDASSTPEGDPVMWSDGTKEGGPIHVAIVNGGISPLMDDSYNFMNSLVHEDGHIMTANPENDFDHFNVIMGQVKNPTFERTTEPYKTNTVALMVLYLNNAISTYQVSGQAVYDAVDAANAQAGKTGYSFEYNPATNIVVAAPTDADKGGFFFSYDSESKQISASPVQSPVTVIENK
jgi:hypothetical protein